MEKIFEITSKVSTPLALAGIVATIFFYILRQMIAKQPASIVGAKSSNKFYTLIIKLLFVLSITAMLLGFSGYVLPIFIKEKFMVESVIFVDDRIARNSGLTVGVVELSQNLAVDPGGLLKMEIPNEVVPKRITLTFSSVEVDFQYFEFPRADSIPHNIHLKKKQITLQNTSGDTTPIKPQIHASNTSIKIDTNKVLKTHNNNFLKNSLLNKGKNDVYTLSTPITIQGKTALTLFDDFTFDPNYNYIFKINMQPRPVFDGLSECDRNAQFNDITLTCNIGFIFKKVTSDNSIQKNLPSLSSTSSENQSLQNFVNNNQKFSIGYSWNVAVFNRSDNPFAAHYVVALLNESKLEYNHNCTGNNSFARGGRMMNIEIPAGTQIKVIKIDID